MARIARGEGREARVHSLFRRVAEPRFAAPLAAGLAGLFFLFQTGDAGLSPQPSRAVAPQSLARVAANDAATAFTVRARRLRRRVAERQGQRARVAGRRHERLHAGRGLPAAIGARLAGKRPSAGPGSRSTRVSCAAQATRTRRRSPRTSKRGRTSSWRTGSRAEPVARGLARRRSVPVVRPLVARLPCAPPEGEHEGTRRAPSDRALAVLSALPDRDGARRDRRADSQGPTVVECDEPVRAHHGALPRRAGLLVLPSQDRDRHDAARRRARPVLRAHQFPEGLRADRCAGDDRAAQPHRGRAARFADDPSAARRLPPARGARARSLARDEGAHRARAVGERARRDDAQPPSAAARRSAS